MPVRTLLRAEGVDVFFGGLHVLHDVSLEVRRGEIVGLIGPNGAGKTTFFNCVSGFVHPRSGRIEFRGHDLLSLAPSDRAGIGIVRTFQHLALCGPQTVWQNVLLAQHALSSYGPVESMMRTPRVRRVEKELAGRARAALELLGLSEKASETVRSLPHGQQRLVEIAAAVAAGPELLLLDEPASGMDPEESAELGRRLTALRDELDLTILIIEHHVPLVATISDHLYVLAGGRVLAEGPPEQVQRDARVISTYLGEPRKAVAASA